MTTETTRRRAEPALHFCTVVSKNRLARARALAESLRTYHPHSPLHVLLVDRPDGYFDPAAEPFTVLPIERLPIPDLPSFCFKYNVVELNAAAKPFFLAHLLMNTGARKLVYLDPDVLLLRELDAVARLLDGYNVVLTPHLTEPYPLDGKRLHERHILLAGACNLGFLALSAGRETGRLLRWWQERVFTGCLEDRRKGMFRDQKWMELAPGYFDGVHLLREPGYNIAYWNLPSRKITFSEGQVWADGRPAYFLHFGGYDPARPLTPARRQNRLRMSDLGEAALLYADYADRLDRHGHEEAVRWPYAFGAFDNGAPIRDAWRRLYFEMGEEAAAFGDPFRTAGASSFFRWLTTSPPGRVAPVFREVIQRCRELAPAFPDPDGKDHKAFLAWARRSRTFLETHFGLPGPVLDAALAGGPTAPLVIRKAGKKAAAPFGVNVAGYLRSEKGVGEAARTVVRSLEAAGIPYVLNDVCDHGSKNVDRRYARASESNPYAANLVQLNADHAPAFFRDRPGYGAGKRTIGYWNWELSEFPEEWKGGFAYFDEIWAPSRFTRDSIAAASPIPVRLVPFSVEVPAVAPPWIDRGRFGLPEDAFLFLFAFDLQSHLERKNPLGLVRAFERAFGDRGDVGLVLKAMHRDVAGDGPRRLREACRGRRNIHLLHNVYSRRETLALMQLCDAYASLHRSEGFGLTIVEAMALGKPVVATGYSANVDFMTEANSRPVRWRLIEIDRDHGPYRKGMAWADPDLDHAAEEMRRLVEDPALGRRLGAAARADVARQLSPAAVGGLSLSALAGGASAAA